MRRLTKRQRTASIVLAALALCFITLDLGGGGLSDAHSGVRGTLGSLYRGTDAVLGPARRWVQGLPSAGSHQAEIDRLRQRNAQLQQQLHARESDQRTSTQLAKLQQAADGGNHVILPGRVIAYGPGQGFDWTATLDVGAHDGVRVGQSVVDGSGLVGRVLHADGDSAVVLLAADPGSGVGARDTRSDELGVAKGDGADGFTFTPLEPHAKVSVGDELITGPTGASTFVSGLSIGTVTAVRSSDDGTVTAAVRPTASPTAVDLVGVITDARTDQAGRDALHPDGGH